MPAQFLDAEIITHPATPSDGLEQTCWSCGRTISALGYVVGPAASRTSCPSCLLFRNAPGDPGIPGALANALTLKALVSAMESVADSEDCTQTINMLDVKPGRTSVIGAEGFESAWIGDPALRQEGALSAILEEGGRSEASRAEISLCHSLNEVITKPLFKAAQWSKKKADARRAAWRLVYFHLTMDMVLSTPTWSNLVSFLRNRHKSMRMTNSLQDDGPRGNIVMMADALHGTGMHVDWSSAVNLAVDLSPPHDEKDRLPVAMWLFIFPTDEAIAAVNRVIRADPGGLGIACPNGLGLPADPDYLRGSADKKHNMKVLTPKQMKHIADSAAEHGVHIIEQHSWDEVTVPPGWIHAVVNLRPCIKFAFDYLVEPDLVKTAISQHFIAAGIFGPIMTTDYSAMSTKLVDEVANAVSIIVANNTP